MVKKTVLFIVLSLLISTGSAFAHGVTVEVSIEGRVVVVSSSYSSLQPLADASVSIYSPADPENAWQTGRTARTGHFAFVPDAEGEWMIVIDDRKGHMKRTNVAYRTDKPEEKEITEDTVTEQAEPPVNRMSNLYKILMGLSLIIGITGLFYGLKTRQERNRMKGN